MSTFLEIKAAIDKQAEAFEAFKETNDARMKALESGDKAEAKRLDDQLKRIEADVSKFGELKKTLEIEQQINRERIEDLESRQTQAGKTVAEKLNGEYREAFESWIRAKGQSPVHEAKMTELSRKAATEAKTITIGTPSAGGYAVPEEISRQIERLELKFSPVRRLVKVVQTASSDYKELVSLGGASSGWVGESGSRTATDTPLLREVTPTHGELYAYPQVSEWALDDVFFNVENWLSEEVAREFALQEGAAVISGNGTNKPTGMLNTTPVTTADHASPLRAAAAYQYINSDTDVDDSPAVPGIRGDSLIELVYALNSAYRVGATWVMNSTTTGDVRKLKTGDGQYLWQPGLQMGQPDRLLGYSVETWEQMPDVGLNTFPIAFGDFKRGYLLTDRVGLRITRDNVTNIGFVKFYIRRREGGIVLNNDAVKFLRTAG